MATKTSSAFVSECLKDACLKAEFRNQNFDYSMKTSKFGHYQTPIAMQISKHLKKEGLPSKSPGDIAKEINKYLDKSVFSSTVVAPSGFITMNLSAQFLQEHLKKRIVEMPKYDFGEQLSCLVDYSSPNIAKQMHVGHLRSTIIGESICRLLEFAGHKVLRINHLGDWGTQFGMLIENLIQTHPDFVSNPLRIDELLPFYQQAKKRFDEDDNFKTLARQRVVLLQSAEPFTISAWKMFCQLSREDFQKVYEILGVDLIERGESFYNEMIPDVVESIKKKGLVQPMNGAQVVFEEGRDPETPGPPPLFLVKGDGGFGYDSTDAAAIYHRFVLEKQDWVVYVTDIGQSDHFHKIINLAKRMDWINSKRRVDHVGFGLVTGADGSKIKTRSGEVTTLMELLKEAMDRAQKMLEERSEETTDDEDTKQLAQDELFEKAKKMGIAALKYFDLGLTRTSGYQFSYDKMLDPRGNTAVYNLYAYARICSIFAKSEKNGGKSKEDLTEGDFELKEVNDAMSKEEKDETVSENNLAFHLLRFGDIIEEMLKGLHIHHLVGYMFSLSTLFTDFYSNCKILGHSRENPRMCLAEATRKTLSKSFFLLGIDSVDRM
eukprot:GHVP01050568.1.p1 GENE.GHVP01050568.1~~GHVP01050568.1.p1  ORF type:complete len:614 (+),score=131.71 GHVP01050568.1:33-1844(+)